MDFLMGKESLFNKRCWDNRISGWKIMNVDLTSYHTQKLKGDQRLKCKS